jgi:hypothetical protein
MQDNSRRIISCSSSHREGQEPGMEKRKLGEVFAQKVSVLRRRS